MVPPLTLAPTKYAAPAPSGQRPASSYWASGSKILTNAWSASRAIPGGPAEDGDEPVELRINGASWSGLESSPCVLGGLEERHVSDYMAWLRDVAGLNALRLPFAARPLLDARQPPPCQDKFMMTAHNQEYAHISYL